MRADQKQKIMRAIERGYGIIAGDLVVHVTAEGVETQILTIGYDLPMASAQEEGLNIDQAGIRSGITRELVFLRSYLESHGVAIQATDHFEITGERWDLIEGAGIHEAEVPIAGIHNLVIVRVRRAEELIQTTQGGEFSYDEPA